MSDRRFPWRSGLLALATVLLLFGGLGLLLWALRPGSASPAAPGGAAGAPPPGVHVGGPATDDERRVADYLSADYAAGDRPRRKYEWVEFGPDDSEGLTHFDDPAKRRLVRVAAYVTQEGAPRTLTDRIWEVTDERPRPPDWTPPGWKDAHPNQRYVGPLPFAFDNPDGRDWLAHASARKKEIEDDAAHGRIRRPPWPAPDIGPIKWPPPTK
jgi:hypothetical protein